MSVDLVKLIWFDKLIDQIMSIYIYVKFFRVLFDR